MNQITARKLGSLFVCFTLMSMALGCVGTARIHRDNDKEQIKGIPFYSKVGYCVSSETWERRWVEVKLTRSIVTNEKPEVEKVYPVLQVWPEAAGLIALAAAVTNFETNGDIGKVEAAYDALAKATDQLAKPEASGHDRDVRTAWALVIEPRVDYTHVQYLNSRMPWFGSSSVGAELHGDGTLTKGNAAAESNAGELLLSWLPIADVLTSKWVPKAAGTDAMNEAMDTPKNFKYLSDDAKAFFLEERMRRVLEQKAERKFDLSAKAAGYRWVEKQEWRLRVGGAGDAPPCATPPAQPDFSSSSRTSLASGGDKKESDSQVSFEGSVTLPKAGGDK